MLLMRKCFRSVPLSFRLKAVVRSSDIGSATPHAAQGGAMAVEDATVLGECLAGMKSPDDLRKAVMAYQAIRKPRCEHVQQIAKGNADMLILPDGPEQEERDRQLKETLEMSAKRRMDIENGVYERPNTEPDPNATTIETPGARMWLYGYDALEEVSPSTWMLTR